jgi:hypothetical protein
MHRVLLYLCILWVFYIVAGVPVCELGTVDGCFGRLMDYVMVESADDPFSHPELNIVCNSVNGCRLMTAFHDIRGTGLQDLVVGDWFGNLKWFENTGTLSTPVFTPSSSDAFSSIDLPSSQTKPSFVDLDSDGIFGACVAAF